MATRLPSGNYRTQVLIGIENGKRQYKSFTASTAKKADLAALQWQAEHPSVKLSGMTLERAIGDYIRTKSAVLSPSTVRGYRTMERVLKAEYAPIMRRKIDVISETDMQNLVGSLSQQHSSKTVRNYYGLLGAVYKSQGLQIPFALCLSGSSLNTTYPMRQP